MMQELSDLYQQLILDHNKSPRNRRRIDPAGRAARGYNPLCGDRVTVYLDLDGDVIRDIAFEGSGCAISTAAASMMTQALKGRTLAEAQALFEQFHDLLAGDEADRPAGERGADLGKLEAFAGVRRFPARVKCATLAWHTFKAALDGQSDPVTTE